MRSRTGDALAEPVGLARGRWGWKLGSEVGSVMRPTVTSPAAHVNGDPRVGPDAGGRALRCGACRAHQRHLTSRRSSACA